MTSLLALLWSWLQSHDQLSNSAISLSEFTMDIKQVEGCLPLQGMGHGSALGIWTLTTQPWLQIHSLMATSRLSGQW